MTEGVGWDQFATRTSQHGRDTPYLLLYHRLGQEDTEERLPASQMLADVIADNLKVERDLKRMADNLDEFDAGMSPPKRPK